MISSTLKAAKTMNNIATPRTDYFCGHALTDRGPVKTGALYVDPSGHYVQAEFSRQLERELHLERARAARAITILKQCVLKKDEIDTLDVLANTVMCNLKELADAASDVVQYGEPREKLADALRNIPDDL